MKEKKLPLRLAYWSMKGGVGRSTLLSQHAFTLAQLGFKVLAVDMDIEAPSLDVLFGTIQLNEDTQNKKEGLETILFDLWDITEPEKRENLLAPAKDPSYKSKLKEMTLNLVEELETEEMAKSIAKIPVFEEAYNDAGFDSANEFYEMVRKCIENIHKSDGGLWLLPIERNLKELSEINYLHDKAGRDLEMIIDAVVIQNDIDIVLIDMHTALSDAAAIVAQNSVDFLLNIILPRRQHYATALIGEEWFAEKYWSIPLIRTPNQIASVSNKKMPSDKDDAVAGVSGNHYMSLKKGNVEILKSMLHPPILDSLRLLEFLPIPLENNFSEKQVDLSNYREAILEECKAIMDTIKKVSNKESRLKCHAELATEIRTKIDNKKSRGNQGE